MLRQTFTKIQEEHAKYSTIRSSDKNDLYNMIVNDIKNLEDKGIKKANDNIKELKEVVGQAVELKIKLQEAANSKARFQDKQLIQH